MVANAYTCDMLSDLLTQAAALMMEEVFALIIVDSIMGPF